MTISLRAASAREYARWYLSREDRKAGRGSDPPPGDPVAVMESEHPGKWRPWFDRADWSVVALSLDDFSHLIYPALSWSGRQGLVVNDGPDYRLLERVARRAIDTAYLDRSDDPEHRHERYFDELRSGSLRLRGYCRIALCSAESEVAGNPHGRWYLLDGAGRCLPWMMLVLGGVDYESVEAFLAEQQPA